MFRFASMSLIFLFSWIQTGILKIWVEGQIVIKIIFTLRITVRGQLSPNPNPNPNPNRRGQLSGHQE